MHCTCNERNQWIPNERNLSSSSTSLPRKSYEHLNGSVKKSALKSSTRPSVSTTPKKSVDIRSTPRYSTLPRSRARHTTPHVATIFNNETNPQQNHRPRRKSEVIPWHQQQSLQCTCRSSCYFCNLNYPKVQPLSASTNTLGFYYPYSTLSLNNPNYSHQVQYNVLTNPSPQYYPPPPNQHHHSMINLNHNHTPAQETSRNLEPLVAESPAMSNSPVPAPPVPPLNPACARCRFTSSVSATSNGTIHRQPISVGSNPHLNAGLSHQNSQPNYGMPPTAGNAYPGEFKEFSNFSLFSSKRRYEWTQLDIKLSVADDSTARKLHVANVKYLTLIAPRVCCNLYSLSEQSYVHRDGKNRAEATSS